MNKARTEKVAVVKGVQTRVDTSATAVVTEYRGLTVAEISSLRRTLRAADAEYKVLKNTLVRRAVEGTASASLSEFLVGPTAIAWVQGDITAVAKILRDFSKATPALVLKGGVLDGKALSARDLLALADLPSRDILLAQLAGVIAAPMRQMAGLLKAVPQSLAYGLAALLESKGGAPTASAAVETEVPREPAEDVAVAEDAETPAEVAVASPPEAPAEIETVVAATEPEPAPVAESVEEVRVAESISDTPTE